MPFAREYGGLLANRSFGGAQMYQHSTLEDKPANSSVGAYQALARQIDVGNVKIIFALRCLTSSLKTDERGIVPQPQDR